MLTVRDVLADLDVRLLAGERRLDTPVRWVHISELPDPTPFLSGGELLLTTGMTLDSAAGQRAYVTALADHGLAGLGLGTGFAGPRMRKAVKAAQAGNGAEVKRLLDPLDKVVGPVLGLLLAAILYLMLIKPDF